MAPTRGDAGFGGRSDRPRSRLFLWGIDVTETLTSEHRQIPIDQIDVLAGRRALDPNWVETLATDFRARGQRTPIEVIQRQERFQLVSGGHRVAAAKLNMQSSIIALVKQPADFASEAEVKLAEIVENFMRRELSALDRAMDVAAWRDRKSVV